jgi:hypothetical protein
VGGCEEGAGSGEESFDVLRLDPNVMRPGESDATLPVQTSGVLTLLQIVALTLGFIAAAWGVFCIYGAAFPGPCGDNMGPGLGVIEAWALDIPVGLLLLGIGWFVRRGASRLRTICIVTSLVMLCLPAIATFLLERRHCP